MKERVIFHCDANSFYASVEISNNPKYAGKAVAVTGNPEKRTGIILTKNDIAKTFGVKTGEAIWQAKQKCPNLICLAPNYKLYEIYSKKLRCIYEKYTDRVESFGIDECWLDVTDTLKFFGNKKALADQIRGDVFKTLNITISVGVSFGKLFAKLGSDLKKPNATTIISKDNYKEIVYPLPITSIIGIGNRLEKRYNKIGVDVLGDIIKIPDNILKKKFGILGLNLKQKLLGNDNDIVEKCNYITPPKSVGNGITTIKDINTRSEIIAVVTMLSEEISTRLRRNQFNALGLSVTIKTSSFEYFHHTLNMSYATNNSHDICKFAMTLIDSFWSYSDSIRAIRICTYHLMSSTQMQQCLFSNITFKSKINNAIDKIRSKHGYFSILPANAIKNSTLDISRMEV